MERFSERLGFELPKSSIQINSMDTSLRNNLWNALSMHFLSRVNETSNIRYLETEKRLTTKLWLYHFKLPLDEAPVIWQGIKLFIRDYFFGCPWYKVYDFIEFIALNYSYKPTSAAFKASCNEFLEIELSGYRFIEDQIAPITSKEEIAEIEEVLSGTPPIDTVTTHIKSALEKYSDRESPDYRNSIKESISAVEAMSNRIVGKDKATLGEALKILDKQISIHPALKKSFSNLYGYTNDADGIRHALLEETQLDSEDARFMLISCSAFINYLKVKVSKAGFDMKCI